MPDTALTIVATLGSTLGFVLLALMLTIQAQGPSFGSLLWALMISAAAVTVAFTLTWQPGWLRPVAQLLRDRTVRTPEGA